MTSWDKHRSDTIRAKEAYEKKQHRAICRAKKGCERERSERWMGYLSLGACGCKRSEERKRGESEEWRVKYGEEQACPNGMRTLLICAN